MQHRFDDKGYELRNAIKIGISQYRSIGKSYLIFVQK